MPEEIVKILRHIFNARIDNAQNYSAYIAWTSARDIVEYALAGNIECLREFDYLSTLEEIATEKIEHDDGWIEFEPGKFIYDEMAANP